VSAERIGSPLRYTVVTLVLVVMTVVNIGLAFVDLRGFNSVVGMAIAVAEVLIMAMEFMHLRWSSGMTRVVGLAGLLWLSILLVGTLDDVLTRGWLPIPGK
jgi:cytochrome c oxidase subunit 4